MCSLKLTAQYFHAFLFAVVLLSVPGVYWVWTGQEVLQCIPISRSVKESNKFHQERIWFDLLLNPNISKIRQLPSHVLKSHGCFWLTQAKTIEDESIERKVESLSKIMQFQMEKVLQVGDCSNRLTLNCGHQTGCGFGCQFHHRAFCVLLAFTLGIPLIHDTSFWPFKSPWGSKFKVLGSECKTNSKTIYMIFSARSVPILHFKTLCSKDACIYDRKIQLQLDQGVIITRELLDLLKVTKHPDPLLWYIGQFIKYSLRFNNQTTNALEKYEKNFTFDASQPVIGIQVRRTDKKTEASHSYHSTEEYMQIAKTYFHILGNFQDPKTVFVASEDHTVLQNIRKKYKLPQWQILGYDSNQTLYSQNQRSSDSGLVSIIRDLNFLAKCDFVICGISSNVCRIVLETMATRFQNAKSRVYSLDGNYQWLMWGLNLNLTLVPV